MSYKNYRTTSFFISILLVLSFGTGYNPSSSDTGQDVKDASSERINGYATAAEGLKVTFVELGSVNCMPCRMMQPVIEKVEKQFTGQVRVIFHDVWTSAGKSEGKKYAIRVIPTQVFLDKSGKEYFRHEGFFSFEDIVKILKQQGVN